MWVFYKGNVSKKSICICLLQNYVVFTMITIATVSNQNISMDIKNIYDYILHFVHVWMWLIEIYMWEWCWLKCPVTMLKYLILGVHYGKQRLNGSNHCRIVWFPWWYDCTLYAVLLYVMKQIKSTKHGLSIGILDIGGC